MKRNNVLKKGLSFALALSLLLPAWNVEIIHAKAEKNEDKGYEYVLSYHDVDYNVESIHKKTYQYENGVNGFLNNPHVYSEILPNTTSPGMPARYPESDAALLDMITEYPVVRNQAPYGTCWAHASIGLAELSVYKQEHKLLDLSELQLAYFMYHEAEDPLGLATGDINGVDLVKVGQPNYLEAGGNLIYSREVLAGWTGIADEKSIPYSGAAATLLAGGGLDTTYSYLYNMVHLRNQYTILMSDKNDVKQAIVNYGGVGVSYHEDSSYNSTYNSYYQNRETDANHAIIIVGWDDNFSKTNFTTEAPGNGAWLIRNSWGQTALSHQGYFWISYYDTSISNAAMVFDCVSNESDEYYDNNYHYDGGAASGYCRANDEDIKAGANVFTVKKANEELKAVSFELDGVNCPYQVKVYKNLTNMRNPLSGSLVATVSGTTSYSGIYTVKLDQAVSLSKDDTYAVVVELGSGKIAIESNSGSKEKEWMISTVSASEGESFLGIDGHWQSWTGGNVRIKALTNTVSGESPVHVTGIEIENPSSTILEVGDVLQLNAVITPSNATNKGIVWTSSNEAVATVSAGKVTGVSAGKTRITAKTADGNYTSSIDIDVVQYIENISITNPSTGQLAKGATEKINYSVTPTGAQETLRFESSNTSVVTVDASGMMKGIGYGVATISIYGQRGKLGQLQRSVFPNDIQIKAEQTSNGVKFSWDKIRNYDIKIEGIRENEADVQVAYLSNHASQSYTLITGEIYLQYRISFIKSWAQNGFVVSTSLANPKLNNLAVFDGGISGTIEKVVGASYYKIYKREKDQITSQYVKQIQQGESASFVDKEVVEGKEYYYSIEAIFPGTNNKTSWENAKGITYLPSHKWDSGKVTTQATYTSTGTRLFTCTGCGSHKTEVIPKLAKRKLSNAIITLEKTEYIYTGSAFTPSVMVEIDNETISSNEYTVSYQNNVNTGVATVTVTANSNASIVGSKSTSFTIKAPSTSSVLKAVSISSLTNATSGITLKWSKNASATGYYVYRSTNGGTFEKVATISKNTTVSYTDTKATENGKKYQYKIVAYKGSAKSPASSVKMIYRLSTPAFSSVTNTAKGVTLKWSKNASATGYIIYRSTDGGKTYKSIQVIEKNTTVNYVDTGAKSNGTKYLYKFVAYKSVSSAKYTSASSKVKTHYYVSKETLKGVSSTSKKLVVKWAKNAKVNAYEIQYSTKKDFKSGTKTVTVTSANTVSKTIQSLKSGTKYYVRVRAKKVVNKEAFYGEWSAVSAQIKIK